MGSHTKQTQAALPTFHKKLVLGLQYIILLHCPYEQSSLRVHYATTQPFPLEIETWNNFSKNESALLEVLREMIMI